MIDKPQFHTGIPQRNLVYAWDGEVAGLRAEIERLRALLREARQYVRDAGNDEDNETQTLSAALLAEIDAALRDTKP